MQGDPKIIALLVQAINAELGAINQYWLQSRIVRDMGFGKLADKLKGISRQKHHHVHQFTDHVILLEGTDSLDMAAAAIAKPGPTVESMLADDLAGESAFIEQYTEAFAASLMVDPTAARLFQKYLKDEEEFLEWLETQIDLIASLGLPLYLQTQVG